MPLPWVVAYAVLAALVMITVVVCIGLTRRLAPFFDAVTAGASLGLPGAEMAPGGLAVGAAIPPFVADEVGRGRLALERVRDEGDVVLLARSGCSPCQTVLMSLAGSADSWVHERVVVVVPSGDDLSALELRDSRLRVAVDESGSTFSAFATSATPYAFAVGRDGHVLGRAIPTSVLDLRLLAEMAADRTEGLTFAATSRFVNASIGREDDSSNQN